MPNVANAPLLSPPLHAAWSRVLVYLELTKPRVTALVLFTTGVGFWLGRSGAQDAARLLPTLVGTALVAGGANALNQWAEREPDALMPRTRHRPLPSGRLAPEAARWFGWSIALLGIATLAFQVNGLAALLAMLSLASYVWWYTPLKRRTALCTLVGAIPGALPPLIGWAAARGTLGGPAWWLFAMLCIWQLPHFLAIAVLYRDEYARAGFRMLPVTASDPSVTARQLILYSLVLLPLSVVPTMSGWAAPAYFYLALALSSGFLLFSARAALAPSRPAMRRVFLASIVYLPLLLGCVVAQHTIIG